MEKLGHLELSCFLRENFSIINGRPPQINILNEKNNGEMVLNLINKNLVCSAHDISSGGLLTALAEMSLGTEIGIKIEKPKQLANFNEYFFGEDQGRYILEIERQNLDKIGKILKTNDIYYENIGFTQKKFFEIDKEMKIDINDLLKWIINGITVIDAIPINEIEK